MDAKEIAVPVRMCPQLPGVQAKAEMGTGLHTAHLPSGHSPATPGGASGRLVHIPEKSILSQQLVESLDFLFLLGATEFQMLDLGGQLDVDLL